jgi:hypothetical protein
MKNNDSKKQANREMETKKIRRYKQRKQDEENGAMNENGKGREKKNEGMSKEQMTWRKIKRESKNIERA